MVIGPTPPGTGVMAEAISAHRLEVHVADEAVALAAAMASSTRLMPDVDDHRARAAPCRAVTNSALPIAAIRMSALRRDGRQVARCASGRR